MSRHAGVVNGCGFVVSAGLGAWSLHDFVLSADLAGALYFAVHLITACLFLARTQEVRQPAVHWPGIVAIASLLSPYAYDTTVLEGAGRTSTSLSIAGASLLLFATVSLGRSFGIRPALRQVRTRFAYRFIRHPVYASYLILDSAFLMEVPTLRNVSVFIGATAILVVRLLAEEQLLSSDPAYLDYKARVRYRLIPFVI